MFFLAVPLRKYLALKPKFLKDLISEDKDMIFTRCVGYFFGIRFIQDEDMTPKETTMFNTMVTLVNSRDLVFHPEKLVPMPFPFERAPKPNPDTINYWKNKKISVSPSSCPLLLAGSDAYFVPNGLLGTLGKGKVLRGREKENPTGEGRS